MASNRVVALLVLLAFGVGTFCRAYPIAEKSISHPEMYVPGIRMPDGLSEPRQRLTLEKVLTGTFSSDTHPPAYYVLMLGWTKLFGTSLLAIRLPSLLFGLASIALVVWIGALIEQRAAGWLAAVLLGLNGHHVVWSQFARMYSMACFLGLLATGLLILIVRGKQPQRALQVLYGLVVLTGLATHVFFWPLFLTQMGWTFLRAWRDSPQMPGVCRLQILLLVLGSPLLGVAAYQSGNNVALLSRAAGRYIVDFVGFAQFMVFPEPEPAWAAYYWPGQLVLFVLSLVLLAAARFAPASELQWNAGDAGWGRGALLSAALLSMALIQAFVIAARMYVKPAPNPQVGIVQLMVALPLGLAVAGILIHRGWQKLATLLRPFTHRRFVGEQVCLVFLLALVPFLSLVLLSYARPLLNARGLVLFTPYLLLVLALGLLVLLSKKRWLRVPLATLLLALHGLGLYLFTPLTLDSVDFAALAHEILPDLQKSDVVLLQKRWSATPILYYLTPEMCRLVELGQYREVIAHLENRRVWVLLFYESQLNDSQRRQFAEFTVARHIVHGPYTYARATLYVRQPAQPANPAPRLAPGSTPASPRR
jgi:4-amino-4-deoxy-L-arabinose transferase-like glycosyltransferase